MKIFENSQDNVELCNDLVGEDETVCKDNYYFNKAFSDKDLTLCDNVVDGQVTEECLKLDELF